MPSTPLSEFRREAQQRAIRFSDVQGTYCDLKDLERAKRERPNEIRAHAWMMFTANSPGCWPFWRHGFASTWNHRLARGSDFTIIPGYDEIGQQIASAFPEYDTDDGTERLWAFLLSPYDRFPSRDELYRRALDLCEAQQPQPTLCCEEEF